MTEWCQGHGAFPAAVGLSLLPLCHLEATILSLSLPSARPMVQAGPSLSRRWARAEGHVAGWPGRGSSRAGRLEGHAQHATPAAHAAPPPRGAAWAFFSLSLLSTYFIVQDGGSSWAGREEARGGEKGSERIGRDRDGVGPGAWGRSRRGRTLVQDTPPPFPLAFLPLPSPMQPRVAPGPPLEDPGAYAHRAPRIPFAVYVIVSYYMVCPTLKHPRVLP